MNYVVAACVVALLGGVVPWRQRRLKLALVLAIVGIVVVLAVPIAMSWIVGLSTPGVGLVWLYAMPVAILYAGIASAIAFLTARDRSR